MITLDSATSILQVDTIDYPMVCNENLYLSSSGLDIVQCMGIASDYLLINKTSGEAAAAFLTGIVSPSDTNGVGVMTLQCTKF